MFCENMRFQVELFLKVSIDLSIDVEYIAYNVCYFHTEWYYNFPISDRPPISDRRLGAPGERVRHATLSILGF